MESNELIERLRDPSVLREALLELGLDLETVQLVADLARRGESQLFRRRPRSVSGSPPPSPLPRSPPPGSLPSILGENLSQKVRQQLLGETGVLLAEKLSVETVAVASYISNTMNPAAAANAQMNLTHEKPLFDVLTDARADSEHMALILNTLGGDGGFPTRIVRFVKEDLKASSFRVVVPHLAKSAGTLLGFASDGVVTGITSQFGPIDPQLPRITSAGQTWVSARAVKDRTKTPRCHTKGSPRRQRRSGSCRTSTGSYISRR